MHFIFVVLERNVNNDKKEINKPACHSDSETIILFFFQLVAFIRAKFLFKHLLNNNFAESEFRYSK